MNLICFQEVYSHWNRYSVNLVYFHELDSHWNRHSVNVTCFQELDSHWNRFSVNLTCYQEFLIVSFAFDTPKIWNELPDNECSATSIASSRRKLKTYLFAKAYPP